MVKLNLGCGKNIKTGYVNIDKQSDNPDVTLADLNSPLSFLEDNSVSEIIAEHVLEHVSNLDELIAELHRVCINKAKIRIVVPLANTLWDAADPTHVRRFNHKTFEYFCQGYNTSYERPGYFKLVSQKINRSPNEWFQGIEWIVANLEVDLEVIK